MTTDLAAADVAGAGSRGRFIQISLAALAFLLGLGMIYATGRDNADFTDNVDYVAAARMLIENGTYPDVGTLQFFRAPLYPLLMASVWAAVGESVFAVKIVQCLLHAVGAIIAFRAGLLIGGNTLVATLAGIGYAANPFFLFHGAAIQTEALHTFLVTLALFLAFRMAIAEDGLRLPWAIACGLAFGLAALCKNSALGVCIVVSVAMLALCYRRPNALAASGLIVLSAFAAILPWSFYNLKTRGEFILINDAGGYALWLGNHPANLRIYEGSFASREEAYRYYDHLGKTLASEQVAEWESGTGYSRLSYGEREALWRGKAVENAVADPATTAKLWWWKFLYLWRPWLSPEIYSMKAALLSAAWQVPLFIFGFAGAVFTAFRRNLWPAAAVFFVVLVFVTVTHTVVVSNMRLRMPYIDPWLTVFAAVAIVEVATRHLGRATETLRRLLEN